MKRAVAFLACAVLLAGCVNPKVRKMEIDRAEVQARLHRYEGLMLAMDIPAISAMFAPDGEMVNPKRPPVHGRDAIEKFLDEYSDFKVLANADTATSTLIDGDTAEQLGNYHQKVRSPEGKLFDAPTVLRTSSSNEASAASYAYPRCSAAFTWSSTSVASSGYMSRPSSAALASTLLRPASSLTSTCWRLPTAPGSTWAYASGRRAIADACRPALVAKAEDPT